MPDTLLLRRIAAVGGAILLAGGAVAMWGTTNEAPAIAVATPTEGPAPAIDEEAGDDWPGLIPEPDEPILRAPRAAPAKTREEMRFDRVDRNRDGWISQAEFLAQRRRNFDRLDRNGDGKLSFEEYAAEGIGRFASVDTDGDGRLSRAEYAATARPAPNRQTASAERCRCPDDAGLASAP